MNPAPPKLAYLLSEVYDGVMYFAPSRGSGVKDRPMAVLEGFTGKYAVNMWQPAAAARSNGRSVRMVIGAELENVAVVVPLVVCRMATSAPAATNFSVEETARIVNQAALPHDAPMSMRL